MEETGLGELQVGEPILGEDVAGRGAGGGGMCRRRRGVFSLKDSGAGELLSLQGQDENVLPHLVSQPHGVHVLLH